MSRFDYGIAWLVNLKDARHNLNYVKATCHSLSRIFRNCSDPVVFDVSDYEVNLSVHPQCKVLELCMIREKKNLDNYDYVFSIISFVNSEPSKMPVKYDTQQETQLGIL